MRSPGWWPTPKKTSKTKNWRSFELPGLVAQTQKKKTQHKQNTNIQICGGVFEIPRAGDPNPKKQTKQTTTNNKQNRFGGLLSSPGWWPKPKKKQKKTNKMVVDHSIV